MRIQIKILEVKNKVRNCHGQFGSERWFLDQRVLGSIPSEGHTPQLQLPYPSGAHVGGNQSMCPSHVHISLSLPLLSLFHLSLPFYCL